MFKPHIQYRAEKLCLASSVVALVSVGMLVGALATAVLRNALPPCLPETVLHATSSHSGETFAMATGRIDEEVEGLFRLDYLTGDLQCWVYYPNALRFGGAFKHNVIPELGSRQGKRPNYVMVTGEVGFPRGAGAADCIIYVTDANTGNVAAYTIPWNRTAARTGTPQAGEFQVLGTVNGHAVPLRE